MVTLKDDHEEMAKRFVEEGLLERTTGHKKLPMQHNNWRCACGYVFYREPLIDKHMEELMPSLDPTSPDFDKNANEVLERAWSDPRMRGFFIYRASDSDNWTGLCDTLTDPYKFLVMIYESLEGK